MLSAMSLLCADTSGWDLASMLNVPTVKVTPSPVTSGFSIDSFSDASGVSVTSDVFAGSFVCGSDCAHPPNNTAEIIKTDKNFIFFIFFPLLFFYF